ncbi:MAG: DoxX-like family protein, partial [Pirellulaceae bacterium]|nr:DoxX-like family protein [Pirellulaceae bacterium]
QCWVEVPVLVFVSLWCLLLAVAEMLRGGLFTEWAVAEQAVRFATPAALGLLLISQAREVSQRAIQGATWLLLLAVAATFLVHGFKAVLCYGPFVDLLLLSEQQWLQRGIEQNTAETLLVFFGWLDIGLAVAILLTRWRAVACYMAFWGFLTATSRVTAFGVDAWPEVLLRAANGGAPLALVVCFCLLRKVD